MLRPRLESTPRYRDARSHEKRRADSRRSDPEDDRSRASVFALCGGGPGGGEGAGAVLRDLCSQDYPEAELPRRVRIGQRQPGRGGQPPPPRRQPAATPAQTLESVSPILLENRNAPRVDTR